MKKIFLILFLSLLSSAHADSPKQNAWLNQALALQREIDLNQPLSTTTFLGTHNSYNSKSYAIPFVRYVDPNHSLSIYEQLDLGIRAIELDAHWTLNTKFKKDILLCHGLDDHVGCSPFDRPFIEGLQEIKDWLKANPGEIVLLYIERHVDGHEPRLAAALKGYLGEFIYQPQHAKKSDEYCEFLPGTLTKAEVRKSGKQLLIVTKDCVDKNSFVEQNEFKTDWHDYVYAGIGDLPEEPFTLLDATIESFTPYPECSKTSIFKDDPEHTSLWRIFEDRTMLAESKRTLSADDMSDLLRCGINMPTFDMLSVNDLRLVKAIWSWAPGYPTQDGGQCAIYTAKQGIQNVSCLQNRKGYACQHASTQQWKVLVTTGAWDNGPALCTALAGDDWHFATPTNGQQMEQLQQAVTAADLTSVWLNYRVNEEGRWVI